MRQQRFSHRRNADVGFSGDAEILAEPRSEIECIIYSILSLVHRIENW